MSFMMAKIKLKNLSYLAQLLADNKIKFVIDRKWPLNETVDALGYLEEGHVQGKVIITVN
jgi:NADPH:quinone reductase-like Zn-dependent oxidoreductase